MSRLLDAHCHLGFCDDPVTAARQLSEASVSAITMTMRPRGFMMDSLRFARIDGVETALGLHPWEITGDDELLLMEFEALAADARFIGEVGLDFSARRISTREAQLVALRRICAACAAGEHVISLHAVNAVDELLEVLAEYDLTQSSICILHSFNGTHEQLLRAVDAGCWFSVGPRLLSAKRAGSYLRSIPADRLLLETDLPSAAGEEWSVAAAKQVLEDCVARVGEERLAAIADNGDKLFV